MAITADEMDRQDIADRDGDLEANGAPSLASGSLASSEATAVMSYNDQTNGSVAGREERGSGKDAKVPDKAKDEKSSQDLPSPAISTTSGATPPGGVLINKKLHPIYFLFVAPPAAASIAWTEIAGEFDHLSKSLFFISGFLYMFLVLFNSSFLRNAPFSIAWWAYTFPSATFASAALLYSEAMNTPAGGMAAFVVALVSTLLVCIVFVKTVYIGLTGQLFGRDPVVGVCLKDAHE